MWKQEQGKIVFVLTSPTHLPGFLSSGELGFSASLGCSPLLEQSLGDSDLVGGRDATARYQHDHQQKIGTASNVTYIR